jgi:hypothetical protein
MSHIIEQPGFRFDDVHKILALKTGLKFSASGQSVQSPEPSFFSYALILEQRYREYQTIRKIESTSGSTIKTYIIPVETHTQYTLVSKSAAGIEARNQIRALYNFLHTDGFRRELHSLPYNLRFKIVSDIREISVPREQFYERHASFDVKWLWADCFSEDASGFISSASAVRI